MCEVLRRVDADRLRDANGWGLPAERYRALRSLTQCRTPAMGGHLLGCLACGWSAVAFNGCRHRHCPSCAAPKVVQWVKARQAEVLPVPYYHVVLELPSVLSELALSNARCLYGLTLSSAGAAVQAVASAGLGGEPGFMTVLQTWTQELRHHVHVHGMVVGGGLSKDGGRWLAGELVAMLPRGALVDRFRAAFLDGLEKAFGRRELVFFGKLARWAEPSAFAALVGRLRGSVWGAYVEPAPGTAEALVAYLGKRAMSDERLVSFDGELVSFRCRGKEGWGSEREVTLDVAEFARRYLQHVLPRGLHRIRHHGFLANPVRRKRLALCRALLGCAPVEVAAVDEMKAAESAELAGESCPAALQCPSCRSPALCYAQLPRPGEGGMLVLLLPLLWLMGVDTS